MVLLFCTNEMQISVINNQIGNKIIKRFKDLFTWITATGQIIKSKLVALVNDEQF